MELISWSLSATDTIFSPRKRSPGEPACPDGTFAAGYTIDAWDKWRVVCLSPLSVEDIEDVYLFGFMVAGFLLIGLGVALVYRKVGKMAAHKKTLLLPISAKELQQLVTVSMDKVQDLSKQSADLHEKLDYIAGQNEDMLRQLMGLSRRVDELCKDLSALK